MNRPNVSKNVSQSRNQPDISRMITNAYLNKNRFYQKQPKVRPRIGIFGNAMRAIAKRASPSNNNRSDFLGNNRVKARVDNNLDGLLWQSESENKTNELESYINMPVHNPDNHNDVWVYGRQSSAAPLDQKQSHNRKNRSTKTGTHVVQPVNEFRSRPCQQNIQRPMQQQTQQSISQHMSPAVQHTSNVIMTSPPTTADRSPGITYASLPSQHADRDATHQTFFQTLANFNNAPEWLQTDEPMDFFSTAATKKSTEASSDYIPLFSSPSIQTPVSGESIFLETIGSKSTVQYVPNRFSEYTDLVGPSSVVSGIKHTPATIASTSTNFNSDYRSDRDQRIGVSFEPIISNNVSEDEIYKRLAIEGQRAKDLYFPALKNKNAQTSLREIISNLRSHANNPDDTPNKIPFIDGLSAMTDAGRSHTTYFTDTNKSTGFRTPVTINQCTDDTAPHFFTQYQNQQPTNMGPLF